MFTQMTISRNPASDVEAGLCVCLEVSFFLFVSVCYASAGITETTLLSRFPLWKFTVPSMSA